MKTLRTATVVAIALALLPANAYASSITAWNSTTVLQGHVVIPVGQTVTVAPNTKITVPDGTLITVNGKLTAPDGLSLSGKSWGGLVVTGEAVLTNFQESGATASFQVATSGSLTIHGGSISGVHGASTVEGSFVANSLHYDKGSGGGIDSNNGTGSITIDHSVLTGAGRNTGDFFELNSVKTIILSNSQMTGAHCAFHVLALKNMKLNHNSIYENSYGFMMYGSSTAGTKTIDNTTIRDNMVGFDEGSSSTKNGSIIITHSLISHNGKNLGLYTGKVKIVSP